MSMTKEILIELIIKLEVCNYTVVGVVCDMGPSNLSLWKISKYWYRRTQKLLYTASCQN